MPWYKTLTFLVVFSFLAFIFHKYIAYSILLNISHTTTTLPIIQGVSTVVQSPWWYIIGIVLLDFYFIAGSLISAQRWRWISWISSVWMGLIFLLFLVLSSQHILYWSIQAWSLITSSSSNSLSYVFQDTLWTLLPLAISIILLCYGVVVAIQKPLVRHIDLSLKNLDPRLQGLKILQLTDIHIGPTIGQRFMQNLVKVAQQENPDLIVITGDLVDGYVEQLQAEVAPIFDLHCPLGVYFVTGNHEWISGALPWIEFLKQGGIQVLQNEHVRLSYQGANFNLLGVEDWDAHRFDPRYKADLAKAYQHIDPSLFSILLAHQPKAATHADQLKIDLQLSGHTHGGQIFPLHALIAYDQKYNRGVFTLNHLVLYVSQGTGYWGPPLRIATRAEISVLRLQPAV